MALGSGYNWQNLYAGIDANRDTQNRFLQAEEREKARQLAQSNTDRQFGLRERQFKFTQDQAEADRLWREKTFGANQAYRNATLGIAQAGERRAQTKFDLAQKNQLATRFASIAQAVQTAPPEQRAMLWQRMIQRFPQLGTSLQSAGIDPTNVDMGTRFMIAQAGSVGGSQSKSGVPIYNPQTGQYQFVQGREQGAPAIYNLPGAPAQYDPNVAARKAETVETTKAQVKARGELPKVLQMATPQLKALTRLLDPKTDEGGRLGAMVGWQGRMPTVRNDTSSAYRLLEQIQGGAFLQGLQFMKGTGTVTEVEGAKAEQAIARLNTATSEKAFREALIELRDIVQTGVRRAYEAAGLKPPKQVTGPTKKFTYVGKED